MSKLLFLTLEFPSARQPAGGVGRMYRDLCRAMPPHQVVAWSPPLPAVAQTPEVAGQRAEETFALRRAPLLAARGWPRWLPTIARIGAYLDYLQTDRVLVGQVLPLGTATWLLSLERPLVYGVFVHGMDVAQAARVRRRRWLLRQVLGGAAAVFAANRYVAGLVGDLGVAAERIHLVYPAPSLPLRPNASVVERLRGQWHLGSGPLLVTVARLVRRKGHNVVLRALEAIWREAPDVRYVVVGAGPELANLQALAAGLSKPQQVSFVGEQSDDEVAAWLALATVFVMTPRALPDGDVEGFGLVYLEAAWFGVPSVAARTGGVAEAVSDGDTGLLVPEGDVAATARAVLRLLHDDGVRRAMGERARRRVTNDFSARRGAETILRVFDRAAERARQAG